MLSTHQLTTKAFVPGSVILPRPPQLS